MKSGAVVPNDESRIVPNAAAAAEREGQGNTPSSPPTQTMESQVGIDVAAQVEMLPSNEAIAVSAATVNNVSGTTPPAVSEVSEELESTTAWMHNLVVADPALSSLLVSSATSITSPEDAIRTDMERQKDLRATSSQLNAEKHPKRRTHESPKPSYLVSEMKTNYFEGLNESSSGLIGNSDSLLIQESHDQAKNLCYDLPTADFAFLLAQLSDEDKKLARTLSPLNPLKRNYKTRDGTSRMGIDDIGFSVDGGGGGDNAFLKPKMKDTVREDVISRAAARQKIEIIKSSADSIFREREREKERVKQREKEKEIATTVAQLRNRTSKSEQTQSRLQKLQYPEVAAAQITFPGIHTYGKDEDAINDAMGLKIAANLSEHEDRAPVAIVSEEATKNRLGISHDGQMKPSNTREIYSLQQAEDKIEFENELQLNQSDRESPAVRSANKTFSSKTKRKSKSRGKSKSKSNGIQSVERSSHTQYLQRKEQRELTFAIKPVRLLSAGSSSASNIPVLLGATSTEAEDKSKMVSDGRNEMRRGLIIDRSGQKIWRSDNQKRGRDGSMNTERERVRNEEWVTEWVNEIDKNVKSVEIAVDSSDQEITILGRGLGDLEIMSDKSAEWVPNRAQDSEPNADAASIRSNTNFSPRPASAITHNSRHRQRQQHCEPIEQRFQSAAVLMPVDGWTAERMMSLVDQDRNSSQINSDNRQSVRLEEVFFSALQDQKKIEKRASDFVDDAYVDANSPSSEVEGGCEQEVESDGDSDRSETPDYSVQAVSHWRSIANSDPSLFLGIDREIL